VTSKANDFRKSFGFTAFFYFRLSRHPDPLKLSPVSHRLRGQLSSVSQVSLLASWLNYSR
jgi:hypothetical protein